MQDKQALIAIAEIDNSLQRCLIFVRNGLSIDFLGSFRDVFSTKQRDHAAVAVPGLPLVRHILAISRSPGP